MMVLECIKSRRSIRKYSEEKLDEQCVYQIIESAIWAPSGKNRQPWRFKIITDKCLVEQLSKLSVNRIWMRTAPCLVAVFLDRNSSYDYIKDVQSCGAAIQNMLLTAHELGIGSCWIGDLLKRSDEIKTILQLDDRLDLMGVVSLGYRRCEPVNVGRKDINEFLI